MTNGTNFLQVDLEPQGRLHVVIELKWAEPEDGNIRPREFRERQGFNRRRGAMRRRVHQVGMVTLCILYTILQSAGNMNNNFSSV